MWLHKKSLGSSKIQPFFISLFSKSINVTLAVILMNINEKARYKSGLCSIFAISV
ncbi:hypothetical protein PTRA_a2636 [Pseudoalteromonas translucida KMM 520]|uniref:Uncharacterized protein n=1 Tax=Pseudoalteromonas translucida KMM 520 TaxID=1315283 RepID=A0A0U2V7G9_9GAMM|nr:hypothetical protein PTRA_a2636 [Pseudoalteromonas translucida KMM 520]